MDPYRLANGVGCDEPHQSAAIQDRCCLAAEQDGRPHRVVLLGPEGHGKSATEQQVLQAAPPDYNGFDEHPGATGDRRVENVARTGPIVQHTCAVHGENTVLETTEISGGSICNEDPRQKAVIKELTVALVNGSANLYAAQGDGEPLYLEQEDELIMNPALRNHIRDERLAIRPNVDTMAFVISLVAMVMDFDTLMKYFRIWLASFGACPQYKLIFTHIDVLAEMWYPGTENRLKELRTTKSLHRLWTSGQLAEEFPRVSEALDRAARHFGRPKCYAACSQAVASQDDSLGEGFSAPLHDTNDLNYFLFRRLRPTGPPSSTDLSRTHSFSSPNGTPRQPDPSPPHPGSHGSSQDTGGRGSGGGGGGNCRHDHHVQMVSGPSVSS